ncbi:MAG: undecaprenyl/decaprenyl-phosphate alpha-N-acetylglucosaminyl 1-phosphate transferase [Phycisphaerales bacterium]|nr:undecaprenyl/decaprenyl-phosphate alpha-N-acetylglucosaminyl 1-phosphate transferase [Phycisphaerales bacterium]
MQLIPGNTLQVPSAIENFPVGGSFAAGAHAALELLNGYALVFAVAFVVTLIATPIVRKSAIALDIIDHPNESRKEHKFPIAYLGGFAVFLGIVVALGSSYLIVDGPAGLLGPVPISVLIGILAITFTGLADDIWKCDPRLKIAGQLVAAAALAIEDVGTRVAEGALFPIFGEPQTVLFNLLGMAVASSDVYYWTGTALIAIFVLGGCNAANLIDGLDGLLTGTSAIMATGLLVLCVFMAAQGVEGDPFESLAGARIVLCLALLGGMLGFLPWNFNPAIIFLGDCGSLLIGYLFVVIILMLGERGDTHLVAAGLIIFALPIMDTALAIVRRKLAGVPMSAPDANHIHHLLKRAFNGNVKLAVLTLYLVAFAFALLGVTLGALAIDHVVRLRVVYAVIIVLFGGFGAFALKIALRSRWETDFASQPKIAVESNQPVAAAVSSPQQES